MNVEYGSNTRPSGALAEATLEFWFDFASGYAYFAALDVEALAERHGRTVVWRPFSLGSAFKVTGATSLSRTPLKCEYTTRDWHRLARQKGVAFNPPPDHPLVGLAALRAFHHVAQIDTRAAVTLAKGLLFSYFEDSLDIDDPRSVAAIALYVGICPTLVLEGIADPAVRQRAKASGDEAVRRGIFGSPWFFVDGEPFWGHDRLPMVERWLERGPW